jgi:acetolactate decarboxylase
MEQKAIEGSLAMVPAAWKHLTGSKDHRAGELYQTSLMTALLDGVYEGDVTYGELHKHGNFGVGTFNYLDGEMVGVDGVFYQLRSDGSATIVRPEQKTPFAVVTNFEPEASLQLSAEIGKQGLLARVAEVVDVNHFAAVRLDGTFKEVRTRTVKQQHRPFPPLVKATAHQDVTTLSNVCGTLAGFWTPAFAQGIGVAGLHLHFLRDDKQAGGHALDFTLQQGVLQVETLRDLHVELPDTRQFQEADLDDAAVDKQIRASEG